MVSDAVFSSCCWISNSGIILLFTLISMEVFLLLKMFNRIIKLSHH